MEVEGKKIMYLFLTLANSASSHSSALDRGLFDGVGVLLVELASRFGVGILEVAPSGLKLFDLFNCCSVKVGIFCIGIAGLLAEFGDLGNDGAGLSAKVAVFSIDGTGLSANDGVFLNDGIRPLGLSMMVGTFSSDGAGLLG